MDPVEIVNPGGQAALLLIGDHAGNLVPAALGDLGVSDADRARHIGWDIGVDALGRQLADRLDAVFVRQRYSRLVIDCNRDPMSAEAVPDASDGTPVPGNMGADRGPRVAEIHIPYQAAIAAALAGRPTDHALVSLHSFTPVMAGVVRPWQIGVLHAGGNDRLALRLLAWLTARGDLVVGDNEPYRMDGTDHSVPRHCFPAGRPYVELEVRQDLIGDTAGVAAMAAVLAEGLLAAL
ncbi:N-formylglutamate amidohydrolase [Polymorphobacter fuscus]|uniref:N-formylglutamate amidohydrolase n=1 Tax=Sandarakinorhabdus fusca TaxID=1439888 RepID=UPI0014304D64|nr:N-formylglutamate amidohydrolase [Polymorphobacter fuscus]NJC08473.1 putative N-formylglutamate amidohydrolase [Polymorphobacter fuscus]